MIACFIGRSVYIGSTHTHKHSLTHTSHWDNGCYISLINYEVMIRLIKVDNKESISIKDHKGGMID